MFCPNCGAESKTGRFCKDCGTQLAQSSRISENEDSNFLAPKNGNHTFFVVVVILGIILIAIMIAIVNVNSASKNSVASSPTSTPASTSFAINRQACADFAAIDQYARLQEILSLGTQAQRVSGISKFAEEIRVTTNSGPAIRQAGSQLADVYVMIASAAQKNLNLSVELSAALSKAQLSVENICKGYAA